MSGRRAASTAWRRHERRQGRDERGGDGAGDSIEEDQPLVDVSTDKTVVEIPAPVSGKVISIRGALGEKVPVGSELAVIETQADISTVTAARHNGLPGFSATPCAMMPGLPNEPTTR